MGMIILVGMILTFVFSIIIVLGVVLGLLWLSVAMIMGEVTWSLMGIAFISYMVVMLVIVLLIA